MFIRAEADQKRAEWPFGGWEWAYRMAPLWRAAHTSAERYHNVDVSNLRFVTLFEWVAAVAMMERLLADNSVLSIDLDLVGADGPNLLSYGEFLDVRRQHSAGRTLTSSTRHMLAVSSRVYSLLQFIQSLGTRNVLNDRGHTGRLSYVKLADEVMGHYTRGDDPTLLMPLLRVETKDQCRDFLDAVKIQTWREAMSDQFRYSPLFEHDELWRVFCHELAVNVFEHAQIQGRGLAAGFLAARVVEPYLKTGELLNWCQDSFLPPAQAAFSRMREGFLELCVSDAGEGFVASLGSSFRQHTGSNSSDAIDILAFAFDEQGTCKNRARSWLTERHALGRILRLVAKYGGVLTLRSNGAEVVYVGSSGLFHRRIGYRGYEPSAQSNDSPNLPGAHFQLLLPLIPHTNVLERENRQSVLRTLPKNFHLDQQQPKGHVVPLYDRLRGDLACVGEAEVVRFRARCQDVASELTALHAPADPLVLDFSVPREKRQTWTNAQFETLLHLLHEVLQSRPVLLVEVDVELARDLIEMERSHRETMLDQSVADSTPGARGEAFAETHSKTFFETFHGVDSTVLMLDLDGKPHFLGLRDHRCEPLLLGLLERSASPTKFQEEITRMGVSESERVAIRRALAATLHPINPLFRLDKGEWVPFWNRSALALEARRVMSRHFEVVAERCKAWRGRAPKGGKRRRSDDTGREYFNLPWHGDWVREFFECSRILSRERNVDEAAQRLLYRLESGLQLSGANLDAVTLLACESAPSLLLASAMHRRWPRKDPPAIADLGFYRMLHPDEPLPRLVAKGGVVIIQDVFDSGNRSRRLIELLKERELSVLCGIALVMLVEPPEATGVTPIDYGWLEPHGGVPQHAMIKLRRGKHETPPAGLSDRLRYWVEPHSLRPFRYSALRGHRRSDAAQEPEHLTRFFESDAGRATICAGHYIYGERHYEVALDMRRILESSIGGEIAAWVADVCLGRKEPRRPWESDRGYELSGEVTAVLMPSHSRIHYLWPRVQALLAQNGRRQPMWLLDATLLLGVGPTYRLPLQFEDQIKDTLLEIRAPDSVVDAAGDLPLRILILDDAIHTGQTTETILEALRRGVSNAYKELEDEPDGRASRARPAESVVSWVRHFSVFNQLSAVRGNHWAQLSHIGGAGGMNFTFEEFARVPGVPVYGGSDCPVCADLARLGRLAVIAERSSALWALDWIRRRVARLQPIPVDSPDFERQADATGKPIILHSPINLVRGRDAEGADKKFIVPSVDVAIWRFHELMYHSYPPSDVLASLGDCWLQRPDITDAVMQITEYERFRWTVLQWCLRQWHRIVADGAEVAFRRAVRRELVHHSPLVEPLFQGLATHAENPHVQRLVAFALTCLARYDFIVLHELTGRQRTRAAILENALTLFLLALPRERLFRPYFVTGGRFHGASIISALERSMRPMSKAMTFTKNLYLLLQRPPSHPEPAWALLVLAENLYRGRDRSRPRGHQNHRMLPQLLIAVSKRPLEEVNRRLLLGALGQFLAALECLGPYLFEARSARSPIAESDNILGGAEAIKRVPPEGGSAQLHSGNSTEIQQMVSFGDTVVEWLRCDDEVRIHRGTPSELLKLHSALDLKRRFCVTFDQVFHETVEKLEDQLRQHYERLSRGGATLKFEYEVQVSAQGCRVLTHVHEVAFFLANWTIEPICERTTGHFCSRIEVHRDGKLSGPPALRFRLLTQFADAIRTNQLTMNSPHFSTDKTLLHTFGVSPEPWVEPTEAEKKLGFTAANNLIIPAGYLSPPEP